MKREYQLDKDFPVHIRRWVPSATLEEFHWHDSYEVGYCLSGKGNFYFGEKRYAACPGDVFVVGSMEKHRAQSSADDPCTFYFLKFDASLVQGTDNELLAPFIIKPKHMINKIDGESGVAAQIGELIRHIGDENEEQDRAYKRMIEGSLIRICVLLLRYYAQILSPEEWNRSLQAYRKLEPALTMIHEYFYENIQLKDIAALLSLSVSRTYHLFKEVMGEGFKEYLTKTRIHEVKKRLDKPGISVTEIYLSCGFQGHASFYRAFKQIVGMTPGEYSGRIIS